MERQADEVHQFSDVLAINVNLPLKFVVSAPQSTVFHYNALQVIKLDILLFGLAECHVPCLLGF